MCQATNNDAEQKMWTKYIEEGLTCVNLLDSPTCFSKFYDKLLVPGTYNGPYMAVQEVIEHVPLNLRANCRVLDVGAGTGQVGTLLADAGFRCMDAMEPSPGMLRILKEKGLYNDIYEVGLGGDSNAIPKGVYDLVLLVGVMGRDRVQVNNIKDLMHFSKTGGLVIIVTKEEYLWKDETIKNEVEPFMKTMEENNDWTRVARKVVPNYLCGKNGLILSYRVM